MPTTDRPTAPLIEATAKLLGDETLPVCASWSDGTHEEGVWHDGEFWTPSTHPHWENPINYDSVSLQLDLRCREARAQWSRLGASGVQLFRFWDALEEQYATAFITLSPKGVTQAHALSGRGVPGLVWITADPASCLHVPALATLPDTDTLAWACWHIEQAIRAKEALDDADR